MSAVAKMNKSGFLSICHSERSEESACSVGEVAQNADHILRPDKSIGIQNDTCKEKTLCQANK
jgi:hypothetical protein